VFENISKSYKKLTKTIKELEVYLNGIKMFPKEEDSDSEEDENDIDNHLENYNLYLKGEDLDSDSEQGTRVTPAIIVSALCKASNTSFKNLYWTLKEKEQELVLVTREQQEQLEKLFKRLKETESSMNVTN